MLNSTWPTLFMHHKVAKLAIELYPDTMLVIHGYSWWLSIIFFWEISPLPSPCLDRSWCLMVAVMVNRPMVKMIF